jgi:hypothetical protein
MLLLRMLPVGVQTVVATIVHVYDRVCMWYDDAVV